MSIAQQIAGEWVADLEAWVKMDPELAEEPGAAEMMLGKLEVTITKNSLTIANFGKPGSREEYTMSFKEESGNTAAFEISEPDSDDTDIFKFELIDDDHLTLWTSDDAADALALKRAN